MCGRGGEVEGFGLITDGGKPLLQQHMLQFLQYPALVFLSLVFLSLAFLSLYTSQYAAFDCNIFSGWWTAQRTHDMRAVAWRCAPFAGCVDS